jgi:cytochrome c biogenesis protein CcdA
MRIKKILNFFAKYFVFAVGFLFVFVIGFIYAMLRPEGILVNAIFLIIVLGWIVFIIFYFWDLIEKNKKEKNKDEIESQENSPPPVLPQQ